MVKKEFLIFIYFLDCGGNISPVIMTTQPQDRVDSAYGTDSNRTGNFFMNNFGKFYEIYI